MIKFILDIVKQGNGWFRSICMLVLGIFVAGMYWANLKASIEYKVQTQDRRLDILEDKIKEIDKISQSLARIEGALGVRKP